MTSRAAEELRAAYAGRRVLVTGHTGFKGGWLTFWLSGLGARVFGFALEPNTVPSLFVAAGLKAYCRHTIADVRDLEALQCAVRETSPEVIFHLAAQPLVRRSYAEPLLTIQTNILGTANLLEALRVERVSCAVVVVTSDKCYRNDGGSIAFQEGDPLGGNDVYSMSKAAAELIVASYRRSFFDTGAGERAPVRVATARAGNVIGGGDWGPDRLIPDAVVALANGKPIRVRNASFVRPWQHVLEPLSGYLNLGQLLVEAGQSELHRYCDAWNFGPKETEAWDVASLVASVIREWGDGSWFEEPEREPPHEAACLRLNTVKAEKGLDWAPRWSTNEAVRRTVDWYRMFYDNACAAQLQDLMRTQISAFVSQALE